MASLIRRGGAHLLKLIQSGADPAVIADVVQLYAKDDGGVVQLFAEAGDGTVTQLTPSGAASSSLALAAPVVSPAAVNLSNEGDVDWFALVTANRPSLLTLPQLHSKRSGGWIASSFEWVNGGVGATIAVPGGVFTPAKTTNAADTTSTTALAASGVITSLRVASNVLTGFGFRFRVPGFNAQRVLRLYTVNQSSHLEVTAALSDGSAAPVSDSNAAGAGVTLDNEWEITYTAPAGVDLIVTCVSIANTSVANYSDCNINAITLGTV